MIEILRLIAALIIPVLLLSLLWVTVVSIRWQQQQQRQRAGNLLLEIPLARSHQRNQRAIGTVFIMTALLLPLVWIRFNLQVRDILSGLVGGSLAIGAMLWYSSFQRTEIRDRGILVGLNLIPWLQIESYQWSQPYMNTLILYLRQRVGLRRQVRLSIQSRNQPEVEQILQQKLNC